MAGCQVAMELPLPLLHWRIGKLKTEQKLRMEKEGEGKKEKVGGIGTAKATTKGEGMEGARQKRAVQ